MADNIEEKNINELFSALPENIKKWLSSEELVFIITEIENKLGLSDEKILIIPSLILRLVVQDLEPKDFIGELSEELGVAFSVARTITEDIGKNALQPIAAELRDKTGLEVKLIYYGKEGGEKTREQIIAPVGKISTYPTSLPSANIPSTASAGSGQGQIRPEKQMSPLTFTATPLQPEKKNAATAPSLMPTSQPIRKEEPMPEAAVPFILHQESSPTSAPTLNQKPQGVALPKTSLTMKVQNYFQSAGTPEKIVSSPISIKVEAPADQQAITQTEQKISVIKQPPPPIPAAKTEIPPMNTTTSPAAQGEQAPSASSLSGQAGQARVVHYSSLRTPIDNLGLPKKEVSRDNVVDLRKFM